MCGKFRAFGSWRRIHDAANLIKGAPGDEQVIYTVGRPIPVVVFDEELGERTVVMMRWGFPKDGGPGLGHIHCRSETIDQKAAFAPLFLGGQRGLCVVETFNEATDRNVQHIIDPHDDAPMAFAVLWQKFETPTGDLWCCVQATVPANELILSADASMTRMPAFLDHDDWATWLGEDEAKPMAVKELLKTKQGVSWTVQPEPRAPKAKKPKPPPKPDPQPGLF